MARGINRLALALLSTSLVVAGAVFLVSADTTPDTVVGGVILAAGLGLGVAVTLAALRPGQV
jgi:hypothetical protein